MSQGTVFSFMTTIGTGSSVAYWGAQTGKHLAAVPISDIKITPSGTVNLSWGISSTCKDPQKVCDFLNLLYSNTEMANLLSYGMEGKHYTVQKDSRIIKYPDGVDPKSVGYGSFIGPFGDATKIYYREPLTDDFVNSIPNYGPTKAKLSKYMGYTFDTSKVTTELSAVSAVITKYAPSLSCGVVDVDSTLKDFKADLKQAGIDKVIAENQSQLDNWLKTNK
jgi:putative aldouronate transport system substrate-binding protein